MFVATVARSRYLPAVQGTIIGLKFGLIDIHCKEGDWFNSLVAYLIAGLALGLLNAGRAWQAWPPLGWCFYLMHRAAIAYGYRPPYVEENGAAALRSLFVLWPAGIRLAIGAFLRFLFSTLDWTTGRRHPPSNDDPAKAESSQPAEAADRALCPLDNRRVNRAEPARHRRLTVASMMVMVVWVAIYLATFRALLLSEPFFGFSTYYSDQYSERAFNSLRVGMTCEEVEGVIGRPLDKVPWNDASGPGRQEMWFYSDRPDPTANYWRRWLLFENRKVVNVTNDFWFD